MVQLRLRPGLSQARKRLSCGRSQALCKSYTLLRTMFQPSKQRQNFSLPIQRVSRLKQTGGSMDRRYLVVVLALVAAYATVSHSFRAL